ncbi:MAG: LptF/LptG family permease [Bacteroidia bacterium]|nr:LptF/LptG family permease [Bacteroidia bacterium]
MKKFYLFIVKNYLKAFLPTFLIVMLILLMQIIWLYVDELIGKGLDWFIIAELMFYFSASLIPQALPLSILLSSIMTFGNLGESYELVAAKASGISIWKMFRPMAALMVAVALFGFFVANVLIPQANLKKGSLLYDVRQQKPALAIKEGVFSQDIPGITIRVGKKDRVTQELQDIIIYDQRESQLHPVIIYAKSGSMSSSEDNRYLFLNLKDGGRYEELERVKGYYYSQQHTTTTFVEERIAFDLNSFKFSRTDENLFKNHWEMLNVLELGKASDSLDLVALGKYEELRNYIKPYYYFSKIHSDTTPQNQAISPILVQTKEPNITSHFDKIASATIYSNAINSARSVKNIVEYSINEYKDLNKLRSRHKIEWHKKFVLSIACIVMFFIGAPLGSIIRKGGFGLPIVISVLLYVCYHIVSLSGEKAAKTEAWSAGEGIWFGIAVFVPIAFFITYKAANDSQLFDKNGYYKLLRYLKKTFQKQKENAEMSPN